ncbi:MAG: hypothetical protein MI807_08715 [Verrucomicrobiales bacterium]|nr:hypothetical protein [Verrucomicrobiales bacterium]
METYRDASIPAAARAMNLVRRHHGMPAEFCEAASIRGKSAAGNVRREARANHLRAKRRKVLLSDIPEGEFPAILQLSGGSNFVILREKGENNEYLVQFPDSRESVVDGERLEEVYDGVCVFLRPRPGQGGAGSGGSGRSFREKVRSAFRPSMETVKSLLFSTAAIVGSLAYLHFESSTGPEFLQRSVAMPFLGILAAAFAALGLVQLRSAVMREPRGALVSELLCIPHFLGTALVLAGWSVAPVALFAGLIAVLLFFSRRAGSMPSRLEAHRVAITGIAFLSGCLGTVPLVFSGRLGPETMTVAVALGTYAVWLAVHADRTLQRVRLATT